ncbi:unnamed protein product [Brassicogethes aeneus]|uniref:RNA-directed DNA polymerase n=1 Tax=Brassicogethes aeneus TaxID=1431903 RepID=A0A9P0B789_BRAAE|nr:unnamed protein product [Brassicogethes aeneus]
MSTRNSYRNQVILDYILSQVRDDERPYLEISVLGKRLVGLLDSGASRTIVGSGGWDILRCLNLPLRSCSVACTVANGEQCRGVGVVSVPMTLEKETRIIDVLVIPELEHKLILGVDFWTQMNIVPDLKNNRWHFAKEPPSIVIDSIQDQSTLSPEQKLTLDELVANKLEAMGSNIGVTHLVQHEIELLSGSKPIKQRYYQVSPPKQQIIDEEIDKMLKAGIIEPCKSPWSSPVCLVRKKDNSYRFCIDYRQLNAVTKKDSYPIPYVASILDRLRDARYLSSLDIKSAYWQVGLAESSRDFTAFTVPNGLYRFKVMPFGLTNAPATWQRLIDTVLGPDLQPFVMVYLDDVIIVTKDFETHLNILTKVFDRLLEAGLVVSHEKCNFCRPQLKYLGYIVDQSGLHPDPEKVEAIFRIPSPRNIQEIRRFIGTASWYRRFVPNFSTIIAPLSGLTKKNKKWVWSERCELSVKRIKECLISAPILTCPDFERPFILQTDASGYGIGAVLSQEFPEGERVICFLSRSLTSQERKYSTTERECLAVIWAIESLRHYLEGFHFKVITDHYSLLWLQHMKDPQGRLARWILRLQPYDFEMIHRKGKDNVVPDMLSRSVDALVDVVDVDTSSFGNTSDKWYHGMISRIENNPVKYPGWSIQNSMLYKFCKPSISEFSDGVDSWKLVVPKDRRKEILVKYHDDVTSGHVGVFKTFWRVRNKYIWPKMKADISRYIKNCRVCSEQKVEQKAPAGLLGSRPEIKQPWQVISLDYIGPFPRSTQGYTYVLVVSDYFSKYVSLFPHRAATAKLLAKDIEEGIFLTYGVPQYVICDNGVQMKSKEFQTLCQRYNSKICYTPLYWPRADPCERVNRVVKTMISSYIRGSQKTWADNLSSISLAIKTARHETTGFSPFFINFGREHIHSGSDFDSSVNNSRKDCSITDKIKGFQKLFDTVATRIKLAADRSKNIYNLRL